MQVSNEQLTYRRNCDHEKSVADKMQSPPVGNLSPSLSFTGKLKLTRSGLVPLYVLEDSPIDLGGVNFVVSLSLGLHNATCTAKECSRV